MLNVIIIGKDNVKMTWRGIMGELILHLAFISKLNQKHNFRLLEVLFKHCLLVNSTPLF